MSGPFIDVGEGTRLACGVLSGRAVSSFRLRLPKLPPAKLTRALPHIMSDYLTDKAADMAFCHLPIDGDDHSIVLACARENLDALSRQAQADGRDLQAIWPDYMQVPPPQSGVAIAEIDGDVLARRADGTGFRLPKAIAETVLVDAETHAAEISTPPREAGFATGRYGAQLPVGDLLAKYKRPVLLAAIALVVWLTATLYGGFSGFQNGDALAQRGEDLFRKKFPDIRRVVNVEAQLRNRLGGVAGASFAAHSGRVMATLKTTRGIRLEKLDYAAAESRLDITLSARNFSALEAARRALMTSGYVVEEGKSEQNAELVLGRFALSPATNARGRR